MNENVKDLSRLTVRQWIAAFNAHDAKALAALYAEDAELFDSGMPGPRRGRAEIEQWFNWRFRSTPTITYTETAARANGEASYEITWIASGVGPKVLGLGGRAFETPGKSAFGLGEGQIIRQRGTYDHLSVLRQIIPLLAHLPRFVAESIYALYLWRNGVRRTPITASKGA